MLVAGSAVALKNLTTDQLLVCFLVDNDFGLCNEATVVNPFLKRAVALESLAQVQPKGILEIGELTSLTFPDTIQLKLADNLLALLPAKSAAEIHLSIDLSLALPKWGQAVDNIKKVHAQSLQTIEKQKKALRIAGKRVDDLMGTSGMPSFDPDIVLRGFSPDQMLSDAAQGFVDSKSHLENLWNALRVTEEMRTVGYARRRVIDLLVESGLVAINKM